MSGFFIIYAVWFKKFFNEKFILIQASMLVTDVGVSILLYQLPGTTD